MTEKRKPGRPPIQDGNARRVLLTLDDATIAKARRIGGNVSAGVRQAVKRYKLRIG